MLLIYATVGFSQSFTGPTINPFGLSIAGGFTSPVFVDIDNENDYDCFNGLGNGLTAYYKNTGTRFNPNFANWYTNPFGISDVGVNSQPTFADIDNDGDYDVYVGEAGFSIYYLKNTGTISSPNFIFISVNPNGISGLGSNVSPVFVDIDDDNDFDLFTGETNGNIIFFRNIGTVSNPQYGNALTNPFGLINVGVRSTPSFSDIDKDGDFDAFIGNENGNIVFFRNSGTKTLPVFELPITNPFGLTDVGSFSNPTFADIDNDGKEDLFVGTETGDIYYFKNTTVVSVEDVQNTGFVELKAYPNPVSNFLNISTKNIDLDRTELSVYSILGEKIGVSVTLNGPFVSIDFSDLVPGIYLLVIKNDFISYSTKIIKSGKGF
jgi:hypothetical protein